MKEFKRFWFGLTPQQQLFAVVFVLILVWVTWNYFDAQKDLVKSQIRNKAEIDKLADQGVKPSYPMSKYQTWGNVLFNAMDGSGTDEEVIIKIFSYQKNDADIIELSKAFGLRKGTYTPLSDPTDLKTWLRDDLDESLVKQINEQLSRQGITKKF